MKVRSNGKGKFYSKLSLDKETWKAIQVFEELKKKIEKRRKDENRE